MSQTALREFSPSAWARVEERTGKEGEENRDSPRTVLSTRPAVTLHNSSIKYHYRRKKVTKYGI
jgi:hypothetical protein